MKLFYFFLSLVLTVPSTFAQQLRYSGSDTVEPLIEAAQVAFARGNAGYKVRIQATGTSSGIRELCTGRAPLVGASRPIKPQEIKECIAAGIQYVEVPLALDAVVMVVSVKNTWLKDLTLAELQTLYAPASNGKLLSWKQLRPSFPDLPLRTAGVGIKHGTFEFFLNAIGNNSLVRSDIKDFTNHGDTGRFVASDLGAIGFMSMGEAKAMDNQLRMVSVDTGNGPVMPSVDAVVNGKYDKLSRTVYLYANQPMLTKLTPLDLDFVRMLISETEKFVSFSNLIPLRSLQYQENKRRVSLPMSLLSPFKLITTASNML